MSETSAQSNVTVVDQHLVWDNHACMPLRPEDHSFLGQLERARRAGVDVITLNAGFGPNSLADHLRMLASFRNWLSVHSEHYQLVKTVEDIDRAKTEGKLGVLFDIEGMAPLDEGDYGMVGMLRELGVGWMLIAYNQNNAAGGGCMDEDTGLTDHGRRIVREMDRVGMMVCCSHSGHKTAMDVMEASDNPVIFSHSNASSIHPHERNIPDELIRACASTGGVVGINGIGKFLGEGSDYVDLIVRHVDHMVSLVGSDHVGLSLDYVYDQQELLDYFEAHPHLFPANVSPEDHVRLAPPEVIPGIAQRLQEMGYTDQDLAGVLGGNWYRVAKQVWH